MVGVTLPSDSIAILDSSVLIAMGGPSTDKYQAFERGVTQQSISVRIPTHVAEELGESPGAYTYQRDRLRAAQDAGWLERATIDFSNPRVSNAVDRTRRESIAGRTPCMRIRVEGPWYRSDFYKTGSSRSSPQVRHEL